MHKATIKLKGSNWSFFDVVALGSPTDALTDGLRSVGIQEIRCNDEVVKQLTVSHQKTAEGTAFAVYHGPTVVLRMESFDQRGALRVRPLSCFCDQRLEIDVTVALTTKDNRA
jgi:hypothetical protein